jgi:TPR repeat protein
MLGAVRRWVVGPAAALFLLLTAGVAVAQDPDGTRVALVIGNSNYEAVGVLPNPVNDANAVAEAFTRLGFDVTLGIDLDYGATRRALQDFELKVATADVAVVFFAGHGIEIGGVNYLIPIDAQLKRDTHVLDEAVPLDRVITAVEQAGALRLIIIDACRDNPFAAQMEMTGATRSVGRGLARVEPGGSTMIAYSAREGTTADDGDGDHSPFTVALLANIETPGLEVSFVFRRVRDDVMAATGGAQEPVVYASLGREEIYFAGAVAPPVPVQPQVAAPGADGNIPAAYQAALAIDTIEAWESFLRYYSEGLYADLARAALNKLRGEQQGGADVALLAPAPEPELPTNVDPAVAAVASCDRYAAYEYDLDRPESVAAVADAELDRNTRAALDACRRAADLNPDDRRMQFQFARAAVHAGRDEEAFQAATRAAELGSAQGMAMVGLSYQFGTGVAQSYVYAADWYRRAADAGSSEGMLQLGYLYDQGLGVAFDLDESGRWFDRAAEAGNAEAIAAIAYRYQQGRGVDADPVEARYWYQRAALRGDAYAMEALAGMYERGEGGVADLPEALLWHQRAADLGLGIAMASLGWIYENGLGVDVDLDTAVDWYRRGAAGGDHVSMFALGRVYEQGVGVAQDYEAAANWYAQSALTGEMPYALVRLGDLFDQGLGVEQNFDTARSLWEEAAAAGEADALEGLGYLYEFGRGVATDYDTAARYYIEALAGGSPVALGSFVDGSDAHAAAIRRAIEAYLVEQGLLAGKPDGVFDEATRSALNVLAGG